MNILHKYGMLHDASLDEIEFAKDVRVLKITFGNIYVLDEEGQELYFPEGKLDLIFIDAVIHEPKHLEALQGASVGLVIQNDETTSITTTSGDLCFSAKRMEIFELN